MTALSPSARKLIGAVLIVSFIVLWAVLVASLAQFVWRWPIYLQSLFYLIMGLAWIFPLKPLIRWSQTGEWSARPSD